MTAIWGPLGWMTLHSVATCYPEAPTPSEKVLMSNWLDMFRDTITCATCRGHFTELLANYRRQYPGMFDSRQAFAVFTFRAHNAVNRRLVKPMYATLEECMQTLQNNVKIRSARDYRVSYINHIMRYWRTMQDMSGIAALRKIEEMRKIETEYVSIRDTNFNVTLLPDVVVLPRDMLEKPVPGGEPQRQYLKPQSVGLRLGVGGFRLRR